MPSIFFHHYHILWITRKKAAVFEKGNAIRILEWFSIHKDEEYADILESVVKHGREKIALR